MPIALFSSKYMASVFANSGCRVTTVAAANPLSASGLALQRISADSTASRQLLDLELSACELPEYVDAGEHLIVVARKE
ncbi:MAG: hypothetical protein FI707_15500 [SAR202 cluster bacterium]|jgi:hypothetical protein|nr:hypothetical protein [Chloroflexota bacterium]MDP6420835.1 hypothetical protein [SAR202 cluster bacterium]HAL47037.1 hypothetical protein [Dehalococcoidia bacterium]MDP6662432.1 hypothetical protein [SAR202 cluster bacterium]MDP6799761.1 hypothetical protein [SAR202 cluster bacterium]|tara:strand:- start:36692 stop:36928 length:237 start_codon:yes stop_codon:yes gene_type:complete